MLVSRTVPHLLTAAVAAALMAAPLHAQKAPVNTTRSGLAVSGYDVVAYRTEKRPVRGRTEFEYQWNGAIWRFSSAAHRDRFADDPARFAPQFGGYCAYAVSRGYTADVDPEAFTVIEDRLYLNYSRSVRRLWEQDVAGNIARGQKNWPGVLAR